MGRSHERELLPTGALENREVELLPRGESIPRSLTRSVQPNGGRGSRGSQGSRLLGVVGVIRRVGEWKGWRGNGRGRKYRELE